MKKLILKTSLYLSAFCMYFVLGTLFFTTTASAYIDPSAVTYILQIVVGIAIAGGAAFTYYYKKIKRKITKTTHSTTVNKTVDYAVHDNDDEFSASQIKENEKN